MYNREHVHILSPAKTANRTLGKKRLLRAGARILLFTAFLLLLKQGDALFSVKEIQISAPANFDRNTLLELSGIRAGTSIFWINSRQAAQRLLEEPAVLSAEVTRVFPSAIAINVTGRAPFAYILIEGDCWFVDSEGLIYRQASRLTGSLPVITGVERDQLVLGQPLKDPDRAGALKAFIAALAAEPDLNLSELNLADSKNMVLYTTAGLKVLLGDSGNMARKLALLREALPYLPEISGCRLLDVRSGEHLVIAEKLSN
ncbi:MAG: FtsQ-type POTRA domain-containing protein [Dethiobacter sp.]|nr:FtsQ-type POTRA domain-containing protein [Dethiobacter sp.]